MLYWVKNTNTGARARAQTHTDADRHKRGRQCTLSLPSFHPQSFPHSVSFDAEGKHETTALARSARARIRTHVHVCGTQDCIVIKAFYLSQLGSRRPFMSVCVYVFARYTGDQVQSRDIEQKEKDGGELMRKQRRIQSIPSITRTAHLKSA